MVLTVAGLFLRPVGIDYRSKMPGSQWRSSWGWALLNPFALIAGVLSLTLFVLHGATYLMLRTRDPIHTRVRLVAMVGGGVAFLLLLSAMLVWWPQPLMDHGGKADHGLATLHLWWICAGYIHGVGFEPRFWPWRLLFSPWLSLPGNLWGLWLATAAL